MKLKSKGEKIKPAPLPPSHPLQDQHKFFFKKKTFFTNPIANFIN